MWEWKAKWTTLHTRTTNVTSRNINTHNNGNRVVTRNNVQHTVCSKKISSEYLLKQQMRYRFAEVLDKYRPSFDVLTGRLLQHLEYGHHDHTTAQLQTSVLTCSMLQRSWSGFMKRCTTSKNPATTIPEAFTKQTFRGSAIPGVWNSGVLLLYTVAHPFLTLTLTLPDPPEWRTTGMVGRYQPVTIDNWLIRKAGREAVREVSGVWLISMDCACCVSAHFTLNVSQCMYEVK